MDFDGLFLANGPGDPDMCEDAVNIIRKQMSLSTKPICGICMGNQLLAKPVALRFTSLNMVTVLITSLCVWLEQPIVM